MYKKTSQYQHDDSFIRHFGLFTDMYEMTMAQGYFLSGKKNETAIFDYFFRKNPFNGGFVVFAGLRDLIKILEYLFFDNDDIEYLRSNGFKDSFLTYLKNFRFSGNIYSVEEGEITFPYEPILRVEGNIVETQLIETLVLNYLNFESLIATKAARIRRVSGERIVIDFGLRRAQGLGGIHASRAAIIGGSDATSNMYSGFKFDLKISGTQAHAWIQSFDNELTAFRKFSTLYPDNCVLLVDTYDTLKSGIINAITVAKEMEERGHRLKGIRLDSGDLAYLSKKARTILDKSGLSYVKIAASNQLDEYVIQSLNNQNAPIDVYGVGTRLITGKPTAALDGVYKLCMLDGRKKIKISDNYEKITLPGIKNVVRLVNEEGKFSGDGILLKKEKTAQRIFHPYHPEKNMSITDYKKEPIIRKVMNKGEACIPDKSPKEIHSFVKKRLEKLPDEHKRFQNPHIYRVGISEKLMNLRNKMVDDVKKKMQLY